MNTLKIYWRLIKPFWCSYRRWMSWLLLAVVIAMTVVQVYLTVEFNRWSGEFYTALQHLEGEKIYRLLTEFIWLSIGMILLSGYSSYYSQKLSIRWRAWMTEHIISHWLSDQHHHFLLKKSQADLDNPDQRIADDIDLLVQLSIDLLLSFLGSLLTLFSFVFILWELSGSLSFTLAEHQIHIPGYMLWLCIIYTILGSVLTQWIGKPLKQLNVHQQKCEADFRFALIERRQNAEAIAGQHGEEQERSKLSVTFSFIIHNWYRLMRKGRNLAFFTTGYLQVTEIAPIFFALPKFLSGAIDLGGLMQIKNAFSSVSGALSWFIFSYTDIAKLSATIHRINHFLVTMEELAQDAKVQSKTSVSMPEPTLIVKMPDVNRKRATNLLSAELSVFAPYSDDVLLHQLNISVSVGQLVTLVGDSGIGKSTLLRLLSGLGGKFKGKLSSVKCFYVPQKIYLPNDQLKAILCYPDNASEYADSVCKKTLSQVGLDSLSEQLHCEKDWGNTLSFGEQQRVLFARIFINKPKLIFIDELTSALDKTSASELVAQLKKHLPDSGVLMVTHQLELCEISDKVIDLNPHAHP